jgi:hypothetical protein
MLIKGRFVDINDLIGTLKSGVIMPFVNKVLILLSGDDLKLFMGDF